MAPGGSLKWQLSHPVCPASYALLTLIACTLAVDPLPHPHDCSYTDATSGCSIRNSRCLRNGQLYKKALGTGFISMYGPSQCPGRAGQWICWPQKGKGGGIIKTKESIMTKVQTLVDKPHEEHVNYVWQRFLPLTPSPRKTVRLPQLQPLGDPDPQLYRLLNSTHLLLNSTNSTLAEDCWLCLSPSILQVLATPMDSWT
jgi:hypothetical protein